MRKYCGPLEISAERAMSVEEIGFLKGAKSSFTKDIFLAGLILSIALIAYPVFDLYVDKSRYTPMKSILGLTIAVTIGTSLTWIFKARAKLKIIKESLVESRVEEFAGKIFSDQYLGALEAIREDLASDSIDSAKIVLVGKTGLIVSVNGEDYAETCALASSKEIADFEHEPFSISLNIHEWFDSALASGKFERRHFSDEEKSELESLISRINWDSLKPLLLPALLSLSLIFWRNYILLAFLILGGSLLAYKITWPGVRLARELKADLDEGDAYIVGENSFDGGNPKFEFLANSGQLWTYAGQPAGLRLIEWKD